MISYSSFVFEGDLQSLELDFLSRLAGQLVGRKICFQRVVWCGLARHRRRVSSLIKIKRSVGRNGRLIDADKLRGWSISLAYIKTVARGVWNSAGPFKY